MHVVASADASNEDLGTLAALVEQLGGGRVVFRSKRAEEELPLEGFPNLARRRDLTPNGTGAVLLGAERVGDHDGRGGLDEVAAAEGVLLVLGDALEDQDASFGEGAVLYVYVGPRRPAAAEHAHFVLPMTTFAEQEGTFTNVDGRVQRFWPALAPPGMARPAWLVLGALLAERTGGEAPRSALEAFALLTERVAAFGSVGYEELGASGKRIEGAGALSDAGAEQLP